MFERDKEDLRSLGIPIEVGSADPRFDDEPGYRIERSAFELPEIDLEPEEAAVIGLAARVWQHAGLAAATSDALVKLKAAGLRSTVRRSTSCSRRSRPRSRRSSRSGRPPGHARPSPSTTGAPTDRRSPPGTSSRGAWSPTAAVGTSSGTTSTARPPGCSGSRASSEPRVPAKREGTFVVPEGTDLRQVTSALAPATADRQAVLLVRGGAGHGLRRHSEPVGGEAPVGWDRLSVRSRAVAGSSTRCSATAPTWSSWSPRSSAARSSTGCRGSWPVG